MATIKDIPEEVVNIMFNYKDISVEDITNFKFSCEQFSSYSYKKEKFVNRWPLAKKLHDKKCEKIEQDVENFENYQLQCKNTSNFIDTGIRCARRLQNYVSQIIHKNGYTNLINNFIDFKQVFPVDDFFNNLFGTNEKFLYYHFYTEELKCLLEQSSRTDCNLTERYIYASMYIYLRQSFVREKWEIFRKQSPEMQLSERAACIIAQWFQPGKDVFYSHIKASLDNYAREVLNRLKGKYPNHPIFSMSDENFYYWQNNNISISNWNTEEGIEIAKTIEQYLFDTLKLQKIKFKSTNLRYLCIDYVLENKCGQGIIVDIIYQSVARRLGLHYDITDVKDDIIYGYYETLIWKPKYPEGWREIRYLLLDDSMSLNSLLQLWIEEDNIGFSITTADDVLQKILDVFTDKYEYNPQLYNNLWMTIPEELLENVCSPENVTKLTFYNKNTNTRSKEVQFAVGMIVKYQGKECLCQPRFLNNSTGVIIGWHQYIDRHNVKLTSDQEIGQNVLYVRNCSNFDYTKKQTHYIILTDNNEMCYVGEDSITLTTPKWINNSEVGRYFCKFEGTHYTPNNMLTRLFPQDAAVLQLPNITTAISDN